MLMILQVVQTSGNQSPWIPELYSFSKEAAVYGQDGS